MLSPMLHVQHLPVELIALLDAELKEAQQQQSSAHKAELSSKASAAATRAGVAASWKPPQASNDYLADGDLSMYTEEMVQRRMRLSQHPAIIQAIEAWWAWLPKDKVEVQVQVQVPAQQEQTKRLGTAGTARRNGGTPPTSPPSRKGRQASTPAPPATQTRVVVGVVKPVYMALVVVIQVRLMGVAAHASLWRFTATLR